jgi:hypothetical protein
MKIGILRAIAHNIADSLGSGCGYFLDLSAGRILSANPDGSDLKTIFNEGRKLPVIQSTDIQLDWHSGLRRYPLGFELVIG